MGSTQIEGLVSRTLAATGGKNKTVTRQSSAAWTESEIRKGDGGQIEGTMTSTSRQETEITT